MEGINIPYKIHSVVTLASVAEQYHFERDAHLSSSGRSVAYMIAPQAWKGRCKRRSSPNAKSTGTHQRRSRRREEHVLSMIRTGLHFLARHR